MRPSTPSGRSSRVAVTHFSRSDASVRSSASRASAASAVRSSLATFRLSMRRMMKVGRSNTKRTIEGFPELSARGWSFLNCRESTTCSFITRARTVSLRFSIMLGRIVPITASRNFRTTSLGVPAYASPLVSSRLQKSTIACSSACWYHFWRFTAETWDAVTPLLRNLSVLLFSWLSILRSHSSSISSSRLSRTPSHITPWSDMTFLSVSSMNVFATALKATHASCTHPSRLSSSSEKSIGRARNLPSRCSPSWNIPSPSGPMLGSAPLNHERSEVRSMFAGSCGRTQFWRASLLAKIPALFSKKSRTVFSSASLKTMVSSSRSEMRVCC
mmetsp:Transcript_17278/g.41609  ORF Transcript_17278/g.41609 Transcript_17278/m.41609 type:complete len:330 (+) Transcript_17278:426-1415(+)